MREEEEIQILNLGDLFLAESEIFEFLKLCSTRIVYFFFLFEAVIETDVFFLLSIIRTSIHVYTLLHTQ